MERLKRVTRAPHQFYVRSINRIETFIEALDRRYTPLGRFIPGPFEGWDFLRWPMLQGLLAMVLIVAGTAFTNSPFKLNLAGTWFFGQPSSTMTTTPSETKLILSIILTYGGLLLLMRVWLRLAEVVKIHKGIPLKQLWWMFAMWAAPMVIAPPLFSRDVFSYAAQGEMTSHAISPYLFGPFSLGSGPFVAPVDPLWGNAPAPYGPLFLFIDGSIAKLARHNALATVVGLRLLAVVSVVLIAFAVVKLARAMGRDSGEAFVLSALNPLVLLTLVAGAHNDALMTGLLVLGIAYSVEKKHLRALLFCSLAMAVKAPAALGLAFVAWNWAGPSARWRERVRPFALGGLVAAVVLIVTSFMAGFGFGWVQNLLSNGTVRSWAAPATAVGLAISYTLQHFGAAVSTTSLISVTRVVGLATAVASTLWLLWHSQTRGWVRSLALALLLFVELGPVVQPWYLAWGLMLLAACYKGREHFVLLALSITAPFIGLPGGGALVTGLWHANLLVVVTAVFILLGLYLLPLGTWTQWSWPDDADLLS